MIEGSIMQRPWPCGGKRMPSIISSERTASPVSSPRRLTRVARATKLPALVPGAPGETLAAGNVLKSSAVVSEPVTAKSIGLRLVTGTPTAAVPRMSEPVISTVSGISSAWATCSCCANAALVHASVSKDAEPSSAANLAPIELAPLMGFIGLFPQVQASDRRARLSCGGTAWTLFGTCQLGQGLQWSDLCLCEPPRTSRTDAVTLS